MASQALHGSNRGNDTRRREKAEGMAFAHGWRAGFKAALAIIEKETSHG